jgi:hypothetical protein
MNHYLISFPSSAMSHVSDQDLPSVGESARAVIRDAKAAGVYVFGGGIDETVPPVRVSACSGCRHARRPSGGRRGSPLRAAVPRSFGRSCTTPNHEARRGPVASSASDGTARPGARRAPLKPSFLVTGESLLHLDLWLAFVAAAIVLLAIPGPTILTVISYSASHGKRATVPLIAGVALGDSTALFLNTYAVTALNPKGIVFFVAFLPQFLNPASPAVPQLWALGVTFVVLAALNVAVAGAASSR